MGGNGRGAPTGQQVWVTRFNDPFNAKDLGQAVAACPTEAKVFVAGYSDDVSTHFDYATVGIDANAGGVLWDHEYNGPPANDAVAIAVSPDGTRVFATGLSCAAGACSEYDCATVAYATS